MQGRVYQLIEVRKDFIGNNKTRLMITIYNVKIIDAESGLKYIQELPHGSSCLFRYIYI